MNRKTDIKLSLVSAIRYLSDNDLEEGAIIEIDSFCHEGYELQVCARQLEGALDWTMKDGGLDEVTEVENLQFSNLLDCIARQSLCLQFIDTFPCTDGDSNLRVLIMSRKMAQSGLIKREGGVGMDLSGKASPTPVLNRFKRIPDRVGKVRSVPVRSFASA
jgi:hypothetical protein